MNNLYSTNMMNIMNPFYQFNMPRRLMGIERLRNEFKLCKEDKDLISIGCSFDFYNNDIFKWKVTIIGPKDTPYEGGIFTLKILFPENYPNKGPEFRFTNKIYHLNVDNHSGHIDLQYLNEWEVIGKVNGKPVYGVKQALFDIFCYFILQSTFSAYDMEMSILYRDNREKFNEIAKKWTEEYAK